MESTRLYPYQQALVRRATHTADPDRRRVLRQTCKTYASSPRVRLPEAGTAPLGPSFEALMASTTSAEFPGFSGAHIEASELSRLLFYGYGVGADLGGDTPRRRTSLSAGGLHPLELYVVAISVRGVEAGVYHFNAWLHCLERLKALAGDEAIDCVNALLAEGRMPGTAAAIVVTGVPLRTCEVHDERGYRILLLEAGQVMQSLHLGTLALGLAARPITNFYDGRVDAMLELDGVDELTVAVHLVGRPSETDSQ